MNKRNVDAGNPLEEKLTGEGVWRDEVQRRLVSITQLDGTPLIREMSDDSFREQALQQEKSNEDDPGVEVDPVTAVQQDKNDE